MMLSRQYDLSTLVFSQWRQLPKYESLFCKALHLSHCLLQRDLETKEFHITDQQLIYHGTAFEPGLDHIE